MRENSFIKLTLALTIIFCVGVALPSLADHKPGHSKPGGGGGGGGGNDTTFDFEAFFDTLDYRDCTIASGCTADDRIRSDGGTYINERGIEGGVSLQLRGQEEAAEAKDILQAFTGDNRAIFLSFDGNCDPTLAPCTLPPFSDVTTRGQLTVRLEQGGWLEMANGEPQTATGAVFFPDPDPENDDQRWEMRFEYGQGFGDLSNSNVPESCRPERNPNTGERDPNMLLNVTRIDLETWEITAGTDTVASLLFTKERGKDRISRQCRGKYAMPFQFTLTCDAAECTGG